MRHLILALFLVFAATISQAQQRGGRQIVDGSAWSYTDLVFYAEVKANGSITFKAMSEGEELAFYLTPSKDKKDEYTLADEPSNEFLNPFNKGKARHIVKEGQNLLCLYNNQGMLQHILSPLAYETGEEEAQSKWAAQIKGQYVSRHGERLTIGDDGKIKFSSIELSYRHITFNGCVLGIIEIEGGTRLQGLWEVKITSDGLKLCKMQDTEDCPYFEVTGEQELFTWASEDIPRFQYASQMLLNDEAFHRIDKPTLRLMRNEILFHHGYVPQSADLVDYLKDKRWYTPRPSNDGIFDELSLIEQLNIELIKAEEKTRK